MARTTVSLDDDKEFKELAAKANAMNTPADTKKALLQIEVTQTERNAIKAYFSAHGVTLKSGLLASFNFAKTEIDAGRATINGGGITKA